jgi:UDP-N-acetylglucosamine 2-epimerase (non-hydrolysing)/GDP/UDP-N,N'-diacetylbacillosamine 2-epimerase (hydrolysing)
MPRQRKGKRRRVCFVTGTRAEFGLMRSTLRAIRSHPNLRLQIVVTGMHLDRSRGRSASRIADEGWTIDRIVPWPQAKSQADTARFTGRAIARLADAFGELDSDIVLLVGDRVEAFAAASAAHIGGRIVAHVHGGDRALGQVDDSLRHAITKLAHVHFPATRDSANRIAKLGEDRWRIRRVGSPGLDSLSPRGERAGVRSESSNIRLLGMRKSPLTPTLWPLGRGSEQFALLVLHPVDPDDPRESARARMTLRATTSIPFDRIIIIYPNNDPGGAGIVRCWERYARDDRIVLHRDLPRADYLHLLGRAAVLVGNSSSGIIEAASFGTPVVNIGPRQLGRQRSGNVTDVPYSEANIRSALLQIWNGGRPKRYRGRNVYGTSGAGARIAEVLAQLSLDDRLRRKLIAY